MNPIEAEHKIALAERLSTLEPYPPGRFAGRGIVICAGGVSIFTNAYVLIHVLRRHFHCRLPIELWHFGPAEVSPRMRALARELDVETIDAHAVFAENSTHLIDGWQLKIYALMWSRFEQVLLLDADIVPTRDPACVFDWPEFAATGAVLWPDIVDLAVDNFIWAACGLEPRAMAGIESGQVLLDKARHWGALQVTLHLNERAKYYYQIIYGDKETWLLGLMLTGSPYALVPHRPATDGWHCLYQRDFQGEALFQHRTGSKWRYAGAQIQLADFVAGAACQAALEDLRAKWNGLVFNPPPREPVARGVEIELARQAIFDWVSPGRAPERIELLSDGEIGIGRSADRLNWHCECDASHVRLVLRDAFDARWRFARVDEDRWHGHAVADRAHEAFLRATPVDAHADPGARETVRPAWPMDGGYSPQKEALL